MIIARSRMSTGLSVFMLSSSRFTSSGLGPKRQVRVSVDPRTTYASRDRWIAVTAERGVPEKASQVGQLFAEPGYETTFGVCRRR